MKVNTLLKMSSAVSTEIVVTTTDENGEEKFYSWDIDYTRKEPNFIGTLHASIDCEYFLPKEVKRLDVESFTVVNDKLLIFTKGDK